MKIHRKIAITPIVLVLAGCSFFSRSQSRFFSLERIAPATQPAALRGAPIGIDGFELPPGLDRREVVIRKADHQLEIRSTEQWSALLQPLALHTLAFDLAARMPEGMVILPGEARPAGAVRSVNIVVEEFAAGTESRVILDARWVLREMGRPDVTRHDRVEVPITSLDSASVASGMSQALAALADHIAAQI